MRIAIVTESFLPTVNGVSNSVARITEELRARGHAVLIVAPGEGPTVYGDVRVIRTPSVPLPGYSSIPVGMPTATGLAQLLDFSPDVVHVAGPVVLGAWGLSAARRLGAASVAVYQTDFPRFARHYKVAAAEGVVWRWVRRVHGAANVTLAPSRAAAADLRAHGVERVRLWGRGVDTTNFSPARRDPALRRELSRDGRVLVGYVGRLAPEKNVALLARLSQARDVQVVIVGDGPDRANLQAVMPYAHFAGYKGGAALAKLFASLDVFVHTGAHETFCQTIQEALASGVPVVAPAAGGPLDLVDDGRNGRLYRPGDAAALTRAVGELVANPGLRADLAARARPSVVERTWPVLTDELLDHYRAVVGPPHRPVVPTPDRVMA